MSDEKIIAMQVKFPENNQFRYGQDFSYWIGVPCEIKFEAEECDEFYILRADGYGSVKDYGNGALFLFKKQEFQFDIKDFIVEEKNKKAIETKIGELEEQLQKARATIAWLIESGNRLADYLNDDWSGYRDDVIQAVKEWHDEAIDLEAEEQ